MDVAGEFHVAKNNKYIHMKRITSITAVILFLTTAFISCKKDNDTNSSSSGSIPTSTVITQGTWNITYYSNNGSVETSNYTGYTFTFTSGGSAAAISGSVVTNGTWNSYNDDSQNKLSLNFGSTDPLLKLKNDWHIIEKTTIKIRLQATTSSGTDNLTFERL